MACVVVYTVHTFSRAHTLLPCLIVNERPIIMVAIAFTRLHTYHYYCCVTDYHGESRNTCLIPAADQDTQPRFLHPNTGTRAVESNGCRLRDAERMTTTQRPAGRGMGDKNTEQVRVRAGMKQGSSWRCTGEPPRRRACGGRSCN